MIPYKKTALFSHPYYEVCKRSSPKERTDSSELTQAMPLRNRKDLWVMSYLLLCTFWRETFKYSLKERKNLAFSLQMWKSKQGGVKWTVSDHLSAKQGQTKVFCPSLKWAVSNAAAHWKATVPAHPVRAPDRGTAFNSHTPTFFLFHRKQSAGGDRRPGEWWAARVFASYAAWKRTQVQLLRSARSSLWVEWCLRCRSPANSTSHELLAWLEETPDSASPEALLFILVVVSWELELFPVSDISITITAPLCKEIMFFHPSKDLSMESYTSFSPAESL